MKRPIRILDLGGTASFWLSWYGHRCSELMVTLINSHQLDKEDMDYDGSVSWISKIIADARDFSIWDLNSIDLIFFNSFLEHLDSFESQKLIAGFIEKTNLSYFLQVPNKYCLIDPHFPSPLVPYFACYPRSLKEILLTIGKFGSGGKSPSLKESCIRFHNYNPLGVKDVKLLFPSGTVKKEITFGICRSIIVYRR